MVGTCTVCNIEKELGKRTICEACRKRAQRSKAEDPKGDPVESQPKGDPVAPVPKGDPIAVLTKGDLIQDPIKGDPGDPRDPMVARYPDGTPMSPVDAKITEHVKHMGPGWLAFESESLDRVCPGCNKKFRTRLGLNRWCENCR